MEKREGTRPDLDPGCPPLNNNKFTGDSRVEEEVHAAAQSAATASPTAMRKSGDQGEDGRCWRMPDPSWFEMEATDGGEMFFVDVVLAYEMEPDEVDDEEPMNLSWIDQPWYEMEESEWCGRDCCREAPVSAQKAARASPAAVEAVALTG